MFFFLLRFRPPRVFFFLCFATNRASSTSSSTTVRSSSSPAATSATTLTLSSRPRRLRRCRLSRRRPRCPCRLRRVSTFSICLLPCCAFLRDDVTRRPKAVASATPLLRYPVACRFGASDRVLKHRTSRLGQLLVVGGSAPVLSVGD